MRGRARKRTRHQQAGFPDMPGMKNLNKKTCRVQKPNIPWAGLVCAVHGWEACRGRAGKHGKGVPKANGPSSPPGYGGQLSWKFICKHDQRKISCKPVEEQKPLLTTGLCAVYLLFISGTASALRSWLLTTVPTFFCLCKPFSCKACPENQYRPNGQQPKTNSNSRLSDEPVIFYSHSV